MVKGNAARRRELTRIRQEEERGERVRKALGPKFATSAEARARLLSDAKIHNADESDLLGWVILDGLATTHRDFCEDYFRYLVVYIIIS